MNPESKRQNASAKPLPEPRVARRFRRQFAILFWATLSILAILGVLFLLVTAARLCRRTPEQSITRPETGFLLPVPHEIESLQMTEWKEGVALWFDVPKEEWTRILACLAPSQVEKLRVAWPIRARLKIKTAQGNLCNLTLFETCGEPLGAFAVEETTGGRFFRCENASRLSETITAIQATHGNRQKKGS
jgi:hypothetical protein